MDASFAPTWTRVSNLAVNSAAVPPEDRLETREEESTTLVEAKSLGKAGKSVDVEKAQLCFRPYARLMMIDCNSLDKVYTLCNNFDNILYTAFGTGTRNRFHFMLNPPTREKKSLRCCICRNPIPTSMSIWHTGHQMAALFIAKVSLWCSISRSFW